MWLMPASARPYHHGHLREALIAAGVQLARAGGPEAVALREASRRVGVSHNAGYRHFPDRDGLLRIVAERAMTDLAALMERLVAEVDERDPPAAARERLRATGRAYVTFAISEPGLFRTAFGVPPALPPLGAHEGVAPSGLGPYAILARQLDELVATGGMQAERRPLAEVTAWSAVHGLSRLLLDGPLRALSAGERSAAIDRLLDDVERGLTD